jgi:hypothetical protein
MFCARQAALALNRNDLLLAREMHIWLATNHLDGEE